MDDNKRRWFQEPFAQHLREIGIGNAMNVRLGDLDPPFIPAMEVPSQEVLDRYLAAHPEFEERRELFAELFHGREATSVNRKVWQKRAAAV